MNAVQFKRWAGWLALVTVFSVACVYLSNWQFNRRSEAIAKINQVILNYDQAPVELSQIAEIDSFDPENEWRAVRLNGHYLPDQAVLVRNRPYNGLPGFLQIIPFELDSGKVIAIETGWLPTGEKQDSPDVIPLPGSQTQSIVGRLRASEPSLNRDAPDGQIATINIDSLINKSKIIQETYRKFYVRAAESYSTGPLPKLQGKPELTEGNHLSYAIQWIIFAIMAILALYWAVRKEIEARKLMLNPNAPVRNRKKTDSDIEDEILG